MKISGILACALLSASALCAYANDDDDDDGGRRHRHHGDQNYRIEVLSGRPDMVAGGDALVRVTVRKKHAHLSDVRVELNGVNVTGAFVKDNSAKTLTGLVTGMRLGRNEIEVDDKRKGHGRSEAELTLVNHPIEGPIISGPHEDPYACATHQFNLPAGLGPLTPAQIEKPATCRRASTTYTAPTPRLRCWRNGRRAPPRIPRTWQHPHRQALHHPAGDRDG